MNENTLTNDFGREVVRTIVKDYSSVTITFESGAVLCLEANSYGRIDATATVLRHVQYDD